ncbi:hypothetical protein SEA_DAKITI_54 [Gordonia phage Dakiti]|uniref:Nucleoside deoxyribosyltransferase n=1 Tax=Gordonia phage Chelms TaxID=2588132 RepID=A0A4Y6EJP1_9CAUD|nr:nucleoside 2-deoxyribosyltransferase [Gordonia phage Chelms]QDF18267.1 hypothetical protein SEA_CHELMS_53 [Gordonia phage Chelms]QOR56198.1 nucleoside deoxyribosyltransferase [Gordonia phage Linetti]WIC40040.1 hypothetical protein SEA_DAKITI_54 [Gordonia phage Dakiti]
MVQLSRKFYIAGPMTGIEGHNFARFDLFTKELRNQGYDVVSPAEIARTLPGNPGDLPYQDYVRADLKEMLDCTDLVLMPGWGGSRGAQMELDIAIFLNMRVWKINETFKLMRTQYGDTRV